MRKKNLVLLIYVMVAFCIIGCSKDTISVKSIDTKTNYENTTENDTKSTKVEEESSKKKKAENTNIPILTRGSIENGIYTNPSTGMSFSTSMFGKIMTDKEFLDQISNNNIVLSESGIATLEQLEALGNGTIYEFMGYFPDNISSCTILFDNMEKTIGRTLSETTYLQIMKRSAKQVYENVDCSDSIKKVTLAGETYHTVTIAFGDEVKALQTYYVRKMDKYMVCMAITYVSTSEQTVNEFINSITD